MKRPALLFLSALTLSACAADTPFDYPAGLTIKVHPNATVAGLNIGSYAGDPSGANVGDFWYNSTLGKYRAKDAGGVFSLGDADLSALNADNLTSGTVPNARLGTNLQSMGGLVLATNGTKIIRVKADESGFELVDAPTGTGDVSAASNFGTDNRLLRSDGALKGVQASPWGLTDAGFMSLSTAINGGPLLDATNTGTSSVGVSGTGTAYGVTGTSTATNGTAIYGSAQGASGIGVFAEATETGGAIVRLSNENGWYVDLTTAATAHQGWRFPHETASPNLIASRGWVAGAYQPLNANLTTWAGVAPSANGQSLVSAANYSAMRTLLTLVPGTDVQAYNAQLSSISGLAYSAGKTLRVNTEANGYELVDPESRGIYVPTGAAVDGTTDDRAAIQTALDAAEAAGGGLVRLRAGTWAVNTVNSPASGDKAAGAYGLEIPSNVTLAGDGDATIIKIVSGGAFGVVGVGISPKGMRTATTDFGASSNVRLRNFKITAATQIDSAGTLINLVHAQDWLVEGVHIAGCYYHGVEIDQSRRLTFRNCRWSGAYTSGSGSWVQLDYGAAGPVNRPPAITTRLVEDLQFEGCQFDARPDTDTSTRDIELTHNISELQLNRVTFRNSSMTGRAVSGTNIMDIAGANTGGWVRALLVEGCTFVTAHHGQWAFYMMQNSGQTFRDITFANNRFTGPSRQVIWAGGSTTATSAINNQYRRGLTIRGNAFYFDKTGMPGSAADYLLLLANQWSDLVIEDNDFYGIGDFPGGAAVNSYSAVMRLGNNWSMAVRRNKIAWEGNNFASNRAGIYISQEAADQAGYTRTHFIEDNLVDSENANWSYGILDQAGTSVPASRAYSFNGNFSNGATSQQNNCLATGPTTAGTSMRGGVAAAVRSITANTTLTEQDNIVNCDTTSGSITVTAPNVLYRRAYTLWKTSASNSLICGSTTVTSNGEGIYVYSDGSSTFTRAIQGPNIAGSDIATGNIARARIDNALSANAAPIVATTVDADRFIIGSGGINAQTGTTYTLLSTDNGKIVTLTNASAITVTVPSGLAVGFTCQCIQGGAGTVTFSASGTTVNSFGSLLSTAGQYAAASIVSPTSNTFILAGNLK